MSLKKTDFLVLAAVLGVLCLAAGCVERKITISTEPDGALVTLNDEEIGTSPVTVGFEWYGDYSVRISKDGYQTLKTHQNLPRPIYDRAPFDLLADMFTSKIDEYKWNFKLEPLQPVVKEELIKSAISLQKEALTPSEKPKKGKKKK
jgi:hypothetical protein